MRSRRECKFAGILLPAGYYHPRPSSTFTRSWRRSTTARGFKESWIEALGPVELTPLGVRETYEIRGDEGRVCTIQLLLLRRLFGGLNIAMSFLEQLSEAGIAPMKGQR